MKRTAWNVVLLALFALTASSVEACDICTPLGGGKPLRLEIADYPLVVFGPVVQAQGNQSTVRIDKVIRDANGALQGKKTIVINRFVPPTPAVRYLIFFQFFQGQLDVLRAVDMGSDRLVKYLEAAPPYLANDQASRLARLRYMFTFLMDEERFIAKDAYLEWAYATNMDVQLVAPTLSASLLRTWLQSPRTPTHCVSLFACLLGACGTEEDLDMLRRMILAPDERVANALDGFLAGYIQRRPEDGWKLAQQILADSNRKWTHRLTLLRMMMFFYNAKPQETRTQVLDCMAVMLRQADTLDIATEQLRKWQIWDYTDMILRKYENGEATSPIVQKKIIRYAISCPLPRAKSFLEKVDPLEVKELRQDLEREAPPSDTNGK